MPVGYRMPLVSPLERQRKQDRMERLISMGRAEHQANALERIEAEGDQDVRKANVTGNYGLRNTALQGEYGLARQGLANQGSLEQTETQGRYGLQRQAMSDFGQLERTNLDNAAAITRQGMANTSAESIARMGAENSLQGTKLKAAVDLINSGAIGGRKASDITGDESFRGIEALKLTPKSTYDYISGKTEAGLNGALQTTQQAGVFDKSTGKFSPDYTADSVRTLSELNKIEDPDMRNTYLDNLWRTNPGLASYITKQMKGE